MALPEASSSKAIYVLAITCCLSDSLRYHNRNQGADYDPNHYSYSNGNAEVDGSCFVNGESKIHATYGLFRFAGAVSHQFFELLFLQLHVDVTSSNAANYDDDE